MIPYLLTFVESYNLLLNSQTFSTGRVTLFLITLESTNCMDRNYIFNKMHTNSYFLANLDISGYFGSSVFETSRATILTVFNSF